MFFLTEQVLRRHECHIEENVRSLGHNLSNMKKFFSLV